MITYYCCLFGDCVVLISFVSLQLLVLSQRLGLGKGGLRMAPEENLLQVLQVIHLYAV
jgi:hypothetical protein